MINACQKLFVVGRSWNAVPQEVRRITLTRIRQRQGGLDYRERRRAEIRERNLVVDVGLPGERILQLLRERREVALSLRGRGHERGRVARDAVLAGGLIRREEERPIAFDRPAERAAFLMTLQPIVLARREE